MKERGILFSAPMVRALLDGSKSQTRRIVATDLRPQSADTYMRGFPPNPQNVRMMYDYAKCDAPAGSRSVSYRVRPPYFNEDRLWVRETWAYKGPDSGSEIYEWQALLKPENQNPGNCWYRADQEHVVLWRPSIFMPRWASRLTREVVSVRVERVQDISEEDAIAEGIVRVPNVVQRGNPFWWNYLFETAHPKRGVKIEPERHQIRGFLSPRDSFRSLWDSINAARGFGWAVNPHVWVYTLKEVA